MRCVVLCCVVLCCVVLCCVVLCCVVLCCVVLCCVVLCCVVLCGVVWCGVVWCGVVWCGVVWCGVVWCVCGVARLGARKTLFHAGVQHASACIKMRTFCRHTRRRFELTHGGVLNLSTGGLSLSTSSLCSLPFCPPFCLSFLTSSLLSFALLLFSLSLSLFLSFSLSLFLSFSLSLFLSFSLSLSLSLFLSFSFSLFLSSLSLSPLLSSHSVKHSSTNTASNFEAFDCDQVHGRFTASANELYGMLSRM